jgi:hypothetical protein
VIIFCLGDGFAGGTGGEGERKGEDTKSSKSSNEAAVDLEFAFWEKKGCFADCGEKLESYEDIAGC